uniref:Uncharacterized protein n=1 Tax=Hemiselmis andersenii TaxID=464988 RepID=A0A6U2DCB2_HEMAN
MAVVMAFVLVGAVHAQDKCYDVEQQAGSRAGNDPCKGYVYKSKICGANEAGAQQVAPFLGGILDSFLTPAECRSVFDPYCAAVKEGGKVKESVGCEYLCSALQSRAVALCQSDAECDANGDKYAGDPLSWEPEVLQGLITGASSRMCCAWLEGQLLSNCDGVDEASVKNFLDSVLADSACSFSPTCLDDSAAASTLNRSRSTWLLAFAWAALALARRPA